jgi:hypothetical protein
MKKNITLPYRFLPAATSTEGTEPFISDGCNKTMTLSDFLRETIQIHALTNAKVSCFDDIQCTNDTGIPACGHQCEQIQCIYVYTQFKEHKLKEAAVILVIHDSSIKQLRFFKGLWDISQSDIMVWCELIPDLAKQEIVYLENTAVQI